MREEPEPFVVTRGFHFNSGGISCAAVLGHRTGNCIVEASVKRAEIVRRDWRVGLDGQISNCLADITVVVNTLRDGEASKQQIVPMLQRGLVDLNAIGRLPVQGIDQLIETNGHTVIDLCLSGWRDRSARDFRAAAADYVVPVRDDEFKQHRSRRNPKLDLPRPAVHKSTAAAHDPQEAAVQSSTDWDLASCHAAVRYTQEFSCTIV